VDKIWGDKNKNFSTSEKIVQTPASESFDFGDFSEADSPTIFNERQMQLMEKLFANHNVTLPRIINTCCRSGNFESLWKGLCKFLHGNEVAASRTMRNRLKRRQNEKVEVEDVYDDV
jgi:hypothetical protein